MTTTPTIPSIFPASLLSAAEGYVNTQEATVRSYATLEFTSKNAKKTPTGRFTKASQYIVDAANSQHNDWSNALEEAKKTFVTEYLAFDLNHFSVGRRAALVEKIKGIVGGTDITGDYSARFVEATAGKENVRENPYLKDTFVLDITPEDAYQFKKVKTFINTWADHSPCEENNWEVHLHVYISESGYFQGARIAYGYRVAHNPKRNRHSDVLSHSHTVEIDRDPRAFSISSCNGCTDEIRAWGAIVTIAANLVDKFQGFKRSWRGDVPEPLERAKALLNGKVLN